MRIIGINPGARSAASNMPGQVNQGRPELRVDEKNPPKTGDFRAPAVGNIFNENDRPNLAGLVAVNLYDVFVKREQKPEISESNSELIATSKRDAKRFVDCVEELNRWRKNGNQPEYALEIQRLSGTTGFHFGGYLMYTKDHLFYFNKTTADWKNFPPPEEARAYLTMPLNKLDDYFFSFVNLCNALYNNNIDFTAKANSRLGFIERLDNMVFYIADYDQAAADLIIKQFLQQNNVGEGYFPFALQSGQEGLSWAREPNKNQVDVWRKISGSSAGLSFTMFEAVKALPPLLAKIARLHSLNNNCEQANVFSAEAERVERLLEEG